MAHNINQIVRKNLSVKPWILSKGTRIMANDCLKKIYAELRASKMNGTMNKEDASKQGKNQRTPQASPLYILKAQRHPKPSTQEKSNSAAYASKMYYVSVTDPKTKSLGCIKKLAKPSLKMYGRRRMGSSTSNSTCSIYRRFSGRKHGEHSDAFGQVTRTYATRSPPQQSTQPAQQPQQQNPGAAEKPNTLKRPLAPKFCVPEEQASETTAELSPERGERAANEDLSLHEELMPVTKKTKRRLSLKNSKGSKGSKGASKPEYDEERPDPFQFWKHPPRPELFAARCNEFKRKNFVIIEQNRRLKISEMSQERNKRRMLDAAVAKVVSSANSKAKKKSIVTKPKSKAKPKLERKPEPAAKAAPTQAPVTTYPITRAQRKSLSARRFMPRLPMQAKPAIAKQHKLPPSAIRSLTNINLFTKPRKY